MLLNHFKYFRRSITFGSNDVDRLEQNNISEEAAFSIFILQFVFARNSNYIFHYQLRIETIHPVFLAKCWSFTCKYI